MGHQHPQGDRLLARLVRRFEVGDVLCDRRIQVERPFLDELHHRHIGEELGDRADAIDRLGGGGDLAVAILVAEARGPDHLLIVHQRDRERGELLVLHLVADELLELGGDRLVRFGRGHRWLGEGWSREGQQRDQRRETHGKTLGWVALIPSKGAKGANFYGYGFGTLAGQKLVSKAAKVANFYTSGIGDLAVQNLDSKVAK